MQTMSKTNPILSVKSLSKKYEINHQKGGYVAMRDVLTNAARHPLDAAKYRFAVWTGKITKEDFWALKDVNFEVYPGEAIGIIGSNGSGKSTLLKILSKITPPTSGEIEIQGKVASLLEVGTGFHPELTGRENIFLNGAILGMSQKQIKANFDAIVDFSGVEQFIDTPVKRYSSGMYVRLAFAVAAHLEPDILLVDEVLAVGDAAFQRKCLGKMDEITSAQGRTVIFVSHNMSAIQNLCRRCVLLDHGRVKAVGETKQVIEGYLKNMEKGLSLTGRQDRKSRGNIRFTSFHVEENGKKVGVLEAGHNYTFCFGYKSINKKKLRNVSVWFAILHESGIPLVQLDTNYTNQNFEILPDHGTLRCEVKNFPVASGMYQVSVTIASGDDIDMIKNAGFLDVRKGDFFNRGQVEEHGLIFIEHNWSEQ